MATAQQTWVEYVNSRVHVERIVTIGGSEYMPIEEVRNVLGKLWDVAEVFETLESVMSGWAVQMQEARIEADKKRARRRFAWLRRHRAPIKPVLLP